MWIWIFLWIRWENTHPGDFMDMFKRRGVVIVISFQLDFNSYARVPPSPHCTNSVGLLPKTDTLSSHLFVKAKNPQPHVQYAVCNRLQHFSHSPLLHIAPWCQYANRSQWEIKSNHCNWEKSSFCMKSMMHWCRNGDVMYLVLLASIYCRTIWLPTPFLANQSSRVVKRIRLRTLCRVYQHNPFLDQEIALVVEVFLCWIKPVLQTWFKLSLWSKQSVLKQDILFWYYSGSRTFSCQWTPN